MEIRKIANFSQDEVSSLTAAGTILGAVAKAVESGEVTEIAEESKALLDALQGVMQRINTGTTK